MNKISLVDLEVFYRIGVTEHERAKPQRLLVTVELDCDFSSAAASDRIEETIDYYTIAQMLISYGERRSWNLLEKLVSDIADLVLAQYQPQTVRVEAKKFPIPQARYVSV